MKKLLPYLIAIIFCLPNLFILYKTFDVLDNIDSLPKKTSWVKGCRYWGRKKRDLIYPTSTKKRNLDIYMASEQEVKQMKEPSREGKADIYLRVNKFSFIDLPEIKFRDKITYYELEDDFVYKTSFSSEPKIIGVATEGNSVSRYHLFVEIMDFYQNLAYFAIFVINLLVGKYYEKIFKTEKGLSLIFVPILFYIIIFIIT